jgi:hypothetical protein
MKPEGPLPHSQDLAIGPCTEPTESSPAEWLALMFRIRELPGSYLGPKTGYPGCGFFVGFLSPSE